jgi:hypothetical protein
MGVKLKIDQNLKISDTPILINIHQKNIKYVLESLRSRKACGIEEIPNDVLKVQDMDYKIYMERAEVCP